MAHLTELPAPRSAWLLKADEASYPSEEDQSRWNSSDEYDDRIWTCSPHVEAVWQFRRDFEAATATPSSQDA
jgi:hypothetical protein